MDRRLLRSNGRVAHISLQGKVKAEHFLKGDLHRVASTVADLCAKPSGPRDRQLLRGEAFVALDIDEGLAFGYAKKDGYAGWIDSADLISGGLPEPTHRVIAQMSYGKSTPGLKDMGRVTNLSFGSLLPVLDQKDGWSRIAWSRGTVPRDLFVPDQHLVPTATSNNDPVAMAERFLGTPYLWGGNSAFGIDCSGLVQAALLACGIPCPGDSDLQEAAFPDAARPYQRGDLLFWKGHVAMVVTASTLIHANAHHMAVAYEDIDAAIARIEKQGDGHVTSHKRPTKEVQP
ncbi:NlpC/P60 family protein [uncultured Shimia sp.]|uniref:C40 family peptidase n=1 Tax=uncultured Shimia sp. TaxID=573152 RepID=UPI002637F2EB|nr:NlpC/P60 family protein [uncultured Shimia sp.]